MFVPNAEVNRIKHEYKTNQEEDKDRKRKGKYVLK